ncbi:peptidyl-prolyl cis-trans isomerase FKBP62 [Trifolium repens]|nr:peptidyl-prolyl cis-trans isomerase FKBP62 [Trifolium repens]
MQHYYNNTYLDGTKAITMSFIRRSQSDTITCGSSICHCRSSLILVVMIIKYVFLSKDVKLNILHRICKRYKDYERKQTCIETGDFLLADADIKKALELDPHNREVKGNEDEIEATSS